MYDYIEEWDDSEEYDIIERYHDPSTVKAVDFQYDHKTAVWTVLEEVATFLESLNTPNVVIYHLSTSEFDDGDCCMTVVYSA